MIGNYGNQPDLDKVFRGLMGSKESSSNPKPGRNMFPSSGGAEEQEGRQRAQEVGILSVGDIGPANHSRSRQHDGQK